MLKKDDEFIKNFKFSKKLGQNFLIDPKIQERIYSTIRSFILPNSRIIEIGPGIGAITKLLCENYDVIAIEIDKKLSLFLKSLKIKN